MLDRQELIVRNLGLPMRSGDLLEVYFGAAGGCSWFLFDPVDDETWVGVFGRGGNAHEAVAVHPSGKAFVIACGRGYLIDIAEKTLLHVAEDDYLADVVAGPDPDLFVVADYIYLYGYGINGERWRTHRISWDGFRNLALDGHCVTGEAWGLDTWHRFVLDLSTGAVSGAAYNGPDARYT